MAKDLVCAMNVDEATAKHTYELEGETYYFCCPACKKAFAAEPARYRTPVVATGLKASVSQRFGGRALAGLPLVSQSGNGSCACGGSGCNCGSN